MMLNQNNEIFLKKGYYLAQNYQTCELDDFLIGVTNYIEPIETGLWHSHEMPIISFVLYGSNKEYRNGKKIERVNGSINFYYPGELHMNIYNIFPSKHISLEIEDTFLRKYNYTLKDIAFAVDNNYEPRFTFIKIMNELNIDDFQSNNSIEMLVLDFLENSINSTDQISLPKWVLSIREQLNDMWNKKVSLKELSDNVNVHPTTISKNFNKYFRCTFGEYTRKLKINHSLDMLHSSNYSITEIAYLCGFSDQSHYTRVFKSFTGYLPKEYAKV